MVDLMKTDRSVATQACHTSLVARQAFVALISFFLPGMMSGIVSSDDGFDLGLFVCSKRWIARLPENILAPLLANPYARSDRLHKRATPQSGKALQEEGY